MVQLAHVAMIKCIVMNVAIYNVIVYVKLRCHNVIFFLRYSNTLIMS